MLKAQAMNLLASFLSDWDWDTIYLGSLAALKLPICVR